MPVSRSNGVDIWYEVKGDGPAMVLVHANPFDHDLWMYQSAHFSTWFKVIGIDIRGYGRSSKVTTPYSLKDMCDDVVGVMRDLGISRAVLGGCSVGSVDRAAAGARPSGAVRRGLPGRRQQRDRARAIRAASTATARISATTTSSICASWSRRPSPTAVSASICSTCGSSASHASRARRSRRCSWPATTPRPPTALAP